MIFSKKEGHRWIKSKTDENEINLRKQCVELSKSGKNISEISVLLQRTRPWVYKWLKRSKSADSQWYLDESKEPKAKPNKVPKKLEEHIVQTRKKLAKRDTPQTRYAFHGAIAIHQALGNLGYKDKPNLSTINRVLKRNGLIDKERRSKKAEGSKKYYPGINAKYPGHIHQLDLVTPRYITGYGKIVSVNRVDVYTNQVNLNQYQSKGADSIIEFIVDDWKSFGIPGYLQLDNECSFRGSLYHPRTFGKLTRFCLNFGVEIIFIPFNEPWRNAYIESFNSRFNTQLWLFQRFTDLEHLRVESKKFREKHSDYRAYKKEQFGKQYCAGYTKRLLPENFSFRLTTELPITKGFVHFIRWVDDKGYVNILNESFFINKELCCEYVWATINTERQTLNIYHQATKDSKNELIKSSCYELRETVKDKIPVRKFCRV